MFQAEWNDHMRECKCEYEIDESQSVSIDKSKHRKSVYVKKKISIAAWCRQFWKKSTLFQTKLMGIWLTWDQSKTAILSWNLYFTFLFFFLFFLYFSIFLFLFF